LILVDAGPFVALFDPKDAHHNRCRTTLERLREPLVTTVPVLAEAFYLLTPASRGAAWLRELILRGGLAVWFLDERRLRRTFELMEQYADRPMDLADASLVAAAEELETRSIFTVDRNDFLTYRLRRGHGFESFTLLP
jgi:hypothetical protein